jgi:hypothetical protein
MAEDTSEDGMQVALSLLGIALVLLGCWLGYRWLP